MKKILFLDIDGVLNSHRTAIAYGGYPMGLEHIQAFDQVAIRMIQRLCDSAGVQIVLSSAWRTFYPHEHVAKALELPIIDKTDNGMGPRGGQIQRWLNAHADEVEAYAIIDDDGDMLAEQLPRFVHTKGVEGLTWADYVKLCGLFGESAFSGSPRQREWQKAALQAWDKA